MGLTESAFRDRFVRSKTFLVSSFDPHGMSSVRCLFRTSAPVAVNPIGFFYDPRRDFVSTTGYYSQTADFTNTIQARFVQSTEIELGALFERVSYGDLTLDVEKPDKLPSFDVDFSWYLRGDSSANPYSARSRVANNPANTSLKDRNLRMTVEMARVSTLPGTDDTRLGNLWEPSNSVRFPAGALTGGNNFIQTDHVRVDITPELRKRLMTVRTRWRPSPRQTASWPRRSTSTRSSWCEPASTWTGCLVKCRRRTSTTAPCRASMGIR